ncbi:HPr family phosphocarrier protein [Rhizohabitans arisaemae]|uniref:HPr family phosphocarrier protein n=1 Tax=Rhizohabitans arisaemae TaxID=2720610 RepID=UPI0024B0BF77|nr:HPr family phosphocarrier protein [Rhizohabitans arisaemae]
MAERKVTVVSEVGLHARPAANFVRAAAKAEIPVTVGRVGEDVVSAKSILAVLGIDVRQGDEIVITADGEGAEDLLDELAAIASTP